MRQLMVDFGRSTPLASGSHRRRPVLCHAKVGPVAPGEERLGIPSIQRSSRNTCLVCLKEEEAVKKVSSSEEIRQWLQTRMKISFSLWRKKSPDFGSLNPCYFLEWLPPAHCGNRQHKVVGLEGKEGKQSVCEASYGCVSAWSGRERRIRGRIWKHKTAAGTVKDSYQSDFQMTTQKLVFFFN